MEVKTSLQITTTAFKDGERIPDRYTCKAENHSPPLIWNPVGKPVKSWALVVEDPSAARGVFTHWLIYNIPAEITSLPEAVPTLQKLQNGALQGQNDAMKVGYTGPCPPPGPVHYYHFNLYALDSLLSLPAGASPKQVREAIRGHIISQGKLVGMYQSSQHH